MRQNGDFFSLPARSGGTTISAAQVRKGILSQQLDPHDLLTPPTPFSRGMESPEDPITAPTMSLDLSHLPWLCCHLSRSWLVNLPQYAGSRILEVSSSGPLLISPSQRSQKAVLRDKKSGPCPHPTITMEISRMVLRPLRRLRLQR